MSPVSAYFLHSGWEKLRDLLVLYEHWGYFSSQLFFPQLHIVFPFIHAVLCIVADSKGPPSDRFLDFPLHSSPLWQSVLLKIPPTSASTLTSCFLPQWDCCPLTGFPFHWLRLESVLHEEIQALEGFTSFLFVLMDQSHTACYPRSENSCFMCCPVFLFLTRSNSYILLDLSLDLTFCSI